MPKQVHCPNCLNKVGEKLLNIKHSKYNRDRIGILERKFGEIYNKLIIIENKPYLEPEKSIIYEQPGKIKDTIIKDTIIKDTIIKDTDNIKDIMSSLTLLDNKVIKLEEILNANDKKLRDAIRAWDIEHNQISNRVDMIEQKIDKLDNNSWYSVDFDNTKT